LKRRILLAAFAIVLAVAVADVAVTGADVFRPLLDDWITQGSIVSISPDTPHESTSGALEWVDVGDVERLVVKNNVGDVSVEGCDVDVVEISYDLTAYAETEVAASALAEELSVVPERRDGVLELLLGGRDADRRSAVSVDYRIRVPRRLSVEVRSSLGEVSVSDVSGDVFVENGHGFISVTGVGGDADVVGFMCPVAVRGVKGDVALDVNMQHAVVADVGGGLTLRETNSTVDVSDLKGPVDATLRFGGFHASRLGDGLRAEADNADLTVDVVSGKVEITSRMGSVVVRGLDGDLDVDAAHGDVVLEVSKEEGYAIDASTENGGIVCRLPLEVEEEDDAYSVKGTLGNGRHAVTIRGAMSRLYLRYEAE